MRHEGGAMTELPRDPALDARAGLSCFLLSLRYRAEMTAVIEATGRSVVSARRPEEALRRFEQSQAMVAVVDARGALAVGLEVLRALSPAIDRRRAALVALVARTEAARLDDVLAAGATHFALSGPRHGELATLLGFADRYVRRLAASGATAAIASAQAALASGARWDWRKGDTMVTVTPAMAQLLGERGGGRVALAEMIDHVEEADREDLRRGLLRLLRGGLSGELTHRMVVDGRVHVIAHHVRANRDSKGRLTGLSATVEDLDAVIMERRLSAHFDTLTGLANAAFAREWLDQLLGGRSDCEPATIAMMLALSRFDGINASYGRQVADALLQAVARRLRRVAGGERNPDAMLARMGGAEFLVAWPGPVTLSRVIEVAERLGQEFEKPFLVGGRVIHLASRIGIAVGEADLDGAETLLRRASAALAQAKAGDPNSFEVYMSSERDDLIHRMARLEDDLRDALDQDNLELLFQPLVDLANNRIVGVEALTRWRHPLLGLLPAETLMGVAESAQMTHRLGAHILAKALDAASAWPRSLGELRLAVNVAAEDMQGPDFAERVLGLVAERGFDPARLTLEVTESGLVRDVEHAQRVLGHVRAAGVAVAIDDFGTGYSSLAYLKSLPLDYIKIDKQLLGAGPDIERDRAVVQGVIRMAHTLGLKAVAEGVETAAQRLALRLAHCDYYQGFLCSPPVTSARLVELVEEWNEAAAPV
jgi:diguanylate cyclase (GGDEF)-like protein